MYKVVYHLPENIVREIIMSSDELAAWLRWRWLRVRIISYERLD